VGAVSGLVDVVDDDITSIKVVGLVLASKGDDTTDAEIHGSLAVYNNLRVDGLTKDRLATVVGSLGGAKEGDDGLELAGFGEHHVDAHDTVFDTDGDLVLAVVVGDALEADAVLLEGVVGAVSGLVDVVDNHVLAVEVVGLVSAGKADDSRDGEVHGGIRVDADHGVDGLAEDGLGARVGATRSSSEVGGESDDEVGTALGEDKVDGEDRVLDRHSDGVSVGVVDGLFERDARKE